VGAIQGVTALVCDVTDDEQVARLRAEVEAREEGLWGLVHNAGISNFGHVTATTVEDMRAVFEVNAFGVHRVTDAFVDLILAAKGRIVTMSSISVTLSTVLAEPRLGRPVRCVRRAAGRRRRGGS